MEKANEFSIHHLYRGSSIEACEGTPYAITALWLEYLRVTAIDAQPYTYLQMRRAVYARRKLTQLGILVKYKHKERKLVEQPAEQRSPEFVDDTNYQYVWVNRTYTTPKHAEALDYMRDKKEKIAGLISGWLFTDGERIVVSIQEVDRMDFETSFGKTYVVNYMTPENQLLKYVGGRPPQLDEGKFTQVKATIKHDEFRGVKETKIQRIKPFETN